MKTRTRHLFTLALALVGACFQPACTEAKTIGEQPAHGTLRTTDLTQLEQVNGSVHTSANASLGDLSNFFAIQQAATFAPAAGSSSIITLGTVGTGTWHGTAIADLYIASAASWNAKQNALTAGTDYLTPNGSGASLTGLTKAQVGLPLVENTALSTWAGSTNVTTLGTVGTGTWHGTAIADLYIASAASWNAKQNALTAGTDYLAPTGDGSGLTGLTAATVGLGNLTNDAQLKVADLEDDESMGAQLSNKIPSQRAVAVYGTNTFVAKSGGTGTNTLINSGTLRWYDGSANLVAEIAPTGTADGFALTGGAADTQAPNNNSRRIATTEYVDHLTLSTVLGASAITPIADGDHEISLGGGSYTIIITTSGGIVTAISGF